MAAPEGGVYRSLTSVITRVSGSTAKNTKRAKGGAGSSRPAAAEDSGTSRGARKNSAPSLVVEDSSNTDEDFVPEVEQEQGEGEGEEQGEAPAVWLRGPSRLPERPIPYEARPVIRPDGIRYVLSAFITTFFISNVQKHILN